MTVSFGRDALTDEVLKAVFDYIEPQKKQFRWGSNILNWSPNGWCASPMSSARRT